MNLNQITYNDKVALNGNASVAAINKIQDSDMNEIKSVVNAIVTSAVNDALTNVMTMLGLATTTFSTTSTYAVGAYVVYDYKLWKCITAVTTAGAWTGTTNWTQSYILDASQLPTS